MLVRVFVPPADALQRADHFKPDVVEQDGGANRGSSGEQVPGQFIAQHDDVAFLRFVQAIEPASLLEGKKPDLVELRFHADNLSVGTGEFTHRAHVIASQHRRSLANVGSFLADVGVVLIGKQIVAGGVHAAGDHGRTAGEDKHDVLPVFGQPALVSRAEPFAQADQQQQRSHTPGHAEHGEERAQLVGPQSAEDLREDVQDHPHNQGTLYL